MRYSPHSAFSGLLNQHMFQLGIGNELGFNFRAVQRGLAPFPFKDMHTKMQGRNSPFISAS